MCESIGIEIVVVVVEPVVGGWCRVRRVRRQRQICEVGEVTSTFRKDLRAHTHSQVGCAGVSALKYRTSAPDFMAHPSQRDTQPSTTNSTQGAPPRRTRSAKDRRVGL